MTLTVMPGGGGGGSSRGHAGGPASVRATVGKQLPSMPPVPHALQSKPPPPGRPLPPGVGPQDKNGFKMTNEAVKKKLEAHTSGPMKADHSIKADRESRASVRNHSLLLEDNRSKSNQRPRGSIDRRSPSEPRRGSNRFNSNVMHDYSAVSHAEFPPQSRALYDRRATDPEKHSGSEDLLGKSWGSRNVDDGSGSSRPSLRDQRSNGVASSGTDPRHVDLRRRSQSLQRPAQVLVTTADNSRPVPPVPATANKGHTVQPTSATPVGSAALSPRERGGYMSKSSSSPSESSASATSFDDGNSAGCGSGNSRGQPPSSRSPAATPGYERTAGLEDSGMVGLQNLGNTCFMNSVLQCMSNTRPLLRYVLREFTDEHINRKTSTMKGGLIRAYVKLIESMWRKDSRHQPVAPKDFKSQIQSFAPRFVGYSQQDAQEFLHYLLQGLHDDINRVQQKVKLPPMDDAEEAKCQKPAELARVYWKRYRMIDDSQIADIFVGQLRSTLTCQSCNYASTTFDIFWDLSVPIPQRTKSHRVSISDCLKAFIEEETLDGDEKPTCSGCKKRTVCTKRFTIQHFPRVLILHLKRFSGEKYRSKLSSLVNFPLDGLDLTPFAAPELRPTTRYRLYGVVNHSGSVNSGHYTAFCRHPFKETSWLEFNDSRVMSIAADSVVTAEAYVLFYEAITT